MGQARSGKVLMSFNRGEVSPDMDARVDLEGAAAMCRRLRNMTVDVAGGVSRRRGLQFVAQAKVESVPQDWEYEGGANATVEAVLIDTAQRTYLGGQFTSFAGQTRNRIARLGTNGLVDATNPNSDDTVHALGRQSDGKIIVVGRFDTIGGVAHSYICRLNADGTLDSGFTTQGAFGLIQCLCVQADDKILVGGTFTRINGVTRNRTARLNADGTLDTSYAATVTSGGVAVVYSMAVQADGQILIGGAFSSVAGSGRNNIARVSSTGTIDSGFNPNSSDTVFSVVVQSDQKILIGGGFVTIAGASRDGFARLNTGGTIDTGFLPATDNAVTTIVIDGATILVGGSFTTIAGSARAGFARINSDGTIVSAFNPSPSGGSVWDCAVLANTSIVVVGNFTTIAGQSRASVAHLNADGTLA